MKWDEIFREADKLIKYEIKEVFIMVKTLDFMAVFGFTSPQKLSTSLHRAVLGFYLAEQFRNSKKVDKEQFEGLDLDFIIDSEKRIRVKDLKDFGYRYQKAIKDGLNVAPLKYTEEFNHYLKTSFNIEVKFVGAPRGNSNNKNDFETTILGNRVKKWIKNAAVKAAHPRKLTEFLEEAILEKIERENPSLIEKYKPKK